MLVLSRKLNESIIVNGNIRITVVGIRGNHVRVGIEAPGSVPIIREELRERPISSPSLVLQGEPVAASPDSCPAQV